MFDRNEFISSFSVLGNRLARLSAILCGGERACGKDSWEAGFLARCRKAYEDNPFFTPYMQSAALKNIAENYLTAEALESLLEYSSGLREAMAGKTVGIIMAGNIPAVGFHDLLCALSAGAKVRVKLSSKDRHIIPAVFELMSNRQSLFASRVVFEDGGKEGGIFGRDIDFLLFSGSDQTKALLAGEFPGVPLLARGSRFSLGVLSGKESDGELEKLAEDIFLYCGLGCRSIQYLFVPKGFELRRLIDKAQFMRPLLEQIVPYRNSYLRQKAVHILSAPGAFFMDGGFFLLEESEKPYPPLGCVRFAFYEDIVQTEEFCGRYKDSIQKKYTNFGFAQAPAIDHWMDGVNTVYAILEGCLGFGIPGNLR